MGVSGVAPNIAPRTTPPATQPVKIALALRYAASAERSRTRGSKSGRSCAATSQEIGGPGIFLECVAGFYDFRPGSASMERMAGSLATVLICDDEPSLRELIRISLDGPYQFVEADDGEESLELARRVRPDVVILDMMMPRLSGLEVLSALRQDGDLADTRVIVLTAQPATREQALSAGADIVMVKPFEPEQIAAAVQEVLAKQA
jgi:CheY-like chemotaxis protein